LDEIDIQKLKTIIRTKTKTYKIYVETQCGKKTTEDDEHNQSTI